MISRTALGLLASLFLSSAAHAQLFRAYLAINGNDANPCTLPQPCRLLPAALNAVASGGEIWLLDSANYNTATVNITKSVTILAVPGAVGSVVATAGSAISIATAGVKVALRNLVLVPLPGGGGTSGVVMTAGNRLALEGCLLAGLPNGITVSGDMRLRVSDTTVRGGSYGIIVSDGAEATVDRSTISDMAQYGVYVTASAASTTAAASIEGTTVERTYAGFFAHASADSAAAKISAKDSHITNNYFGAAAQSSSGSSAVVNLLGNIITRNSNGVATYFAGTRAWLSGNLVTDNNSIGLYNSGALIESAGNNAVRNNGINTSGTITLAPPI
ncbi:MAG: right-handed parallel beta-helix repeat-containing protein [Burkholderiales bacterium]|nr:right-handed parallel beta-helix repeat-containing protein [Burkholderiales bacterium]MBZ0249864.1 right-handed parallel beta-helix repeat-containing protein [Burkholderiales bacterium]MCL4687132.1 right-handed parallel beta-helix repeat-containing protein [Burkholderiales bacterium]